jgi:uncharacterized membrane protein
MKYIIAGISLIFLGFTWPLFPLAYYWFVTLTWEKVIEILPQFLMLTGLVLLFIGVFHAMEYRESEVKIDSEENKIEPI